MRLFLALFVALLAVRSAAAQTSYTWAGGASGSWQTPTNWTPQGVPGVLDDASFSYNTVVSISSDVSVSSIRMSGPSQSSTIVNVSSTQGVFRYIGGVTSNLGKIFISARVDTVGAVATSGARMVGYGSVDLENVGGVGSVQAGTGGGVKINGSALVLGDVKANYGTVNIVGSFISILKLSTDYTPSYGGGRITVSSSETTGATRIGEVSSATGSTIDLRNIRAQIGSMYLQGFTGGSGGETLIENADVDIFGNRNCAESPPVKIGNELRIRKLDCGQIRLEASRPGASVVFGRVTSSSALSTVNVRNVMTLYNGLNLKIDGLVQILSPISTYGNKFDILGGVFLILPGSRLVADSRTFSIAGSGSLVVDGELSIGSTVAGSSPQPAVSIAVPARINGTLRIDLASSDNGAASRVSFAQLTAGGALAFGYSASSVAPFEVGSTLTPFTYTALTGTFAPVTFPPLSANRVWTFALEPTQARLAVVQGQAPVVVNDNVATDEDTPVTFNPAANDTAQQGSTLMTTAAGPSRLGQVALAADGTVTVTPAPNVSGEDTFPYTVRGSNGAESTGQIHLAVRPVNDAPVAADDAATTDEAVVVQIDVLANDTDIDGPALAIASVERPPVGNAFRSEGKILYSPPVGFVGTVTFGYTVTDGALSDEGQVTVTVRRYTSAEAVPVAVAVSAVSPVSPNPSSGAVSVRVSLPSSSRVSVDVYDALGRRMPQSVPETLGAGEHTVSLGRGLAPGSYVYRVRVEGSGEPVAKTGRFVVVR